MACPLAQATASEICEHRFRALGHTRTGGRYTPKLRPLWGPGRVRPWTAERVEAVRAALPARYRAMVDAAGGCGLRQGEVFGLPVDEGRPGTGWLHVGFQIKDIGGRPVFAPSKRGKVRDVPLPERVAGIFEARLAAFPPETVTPVTKRLLFSRRQGGPVRRSDFSTYAWKPALVTAGVIPPPEKWGRVQASREDGMHALRHFCASVLLDSGESVKALSGYLGHTDPGFTLRVHTHLMPSSGGRTRRAVDALYDALGWAAPPGPRSPETAQEGQKP